MSEAYRWRGPYPDHNIARVSRATGHHSREAWSRRLSLGAPMRLLVRDPARARGIARAPRAPTTRTRRSARRSTACEQCPAHTGWSLHGSVVSNSVERVGSLHLVPRRVSPGLVLLRPATTRRRGADPKNRHGEPAACGTVCARRCSSRTDPRTTRRLGRRKMAVATGPDDRRTPRAGLDGTGPEAITLAETAEVLAEAASRALRGGGSPSSRRGPVVALRGNRIRRMGAEHGIATGSGRHEPLMWSCLTSRPGLQRA